MSDREFSLYIILAARICRRDLSDMFHQGEVVVLEDYYEEHEVEDFLEIGAVDLLEVIEPDG